LSRRFRKNPFSEKNSKVLQQLLVNHGNLDTLEGIEKFKKGYLAEFFARIFCKNNVRRVPRQKSVSSFVTIFEHFAKRGTNWLQFFESVTAFLRLCNNLIELQFILIC